MTPLDEHESKFIKDLEKLSGKKIPKIDFSSAVQLQTFKSKYENFMPHYIREGQRLLETDRFMQPVRKRTMGFTSKDGHIKDLVIKRVKEIPKSIGNLSELKTLYIDGPRNLPKDIGFLSSLEELHLTGWIEELPEGFGYLKNLKILNFLGTHSLTLLPESIGDLKSLEIWNMIGDSNCSLNMRNIPIRKLPRSIKNLKKLKKLNLSGCKSIEWIPDELGNLESLEMLDLGEYDKDIDSIARGAYTPIIDTSFEEIRNLCRKAFTLPESIGKLKSLKHLKLCFWKNLKYLPEAIGDLESLVLLDLRFCDSITSLPESIGNLPNLEGINLRECFRIEKLPDNIGELTSLHTLILKGCKKLDALPKSFKELNSLKFFDLRNCNFKEIPQSFIDLNNFKSIDVSGNPLHKEFNDDFSNRIEKKIIDSLPVNPYKIYKQYMESLTDKQKVEEKLISMINVSKSEFIHTRCIEILIKLSSKSSKVLNILRREIKFNESENVRTACAKALIELFPEKCDPIIEEVALNDTSAYLVTSLYKMLDDLNSSISSKIKDRILERYAKLHHVVKEEAQFFLDLETLTVHEPPAMSYQYLTRNPFQIGEGGKYGHEWNEIKKFCESIERALCGEFDTSYVLKNGHVVGISVSLWNVNRVPESVILLRDLEYLCSGHSVNVPKSVKNLKNLKAVRTTSYHFDEDNNPHPDEIRFY
ncbi:MAG: leucine-rich repeat domain-containing protein [Candidatus Hodarchaeota archaeon]